MTEPLTRLSGEDLTFWWLDSPVEVRIDDAVDGRTSHRVIPVLSDPQDACRSTFPDGKRRSYSDGRSSGKAERRDLSRARTLGACAARVERALSVLAPLVARHPRRHLGEAPTEVAPTVMRRRGRCHRQPGVLLCRCREAPPRWAGSAPSDLMLRYLRVETRRSRHASRQAARAAARARSRARGGAPTPGYV
jgi:hypothetical protein